MGIYKKNLTESIYSAVDVHDLAFCYGWTAIIVKSIISLAHNLRLRVVAEGVETPDQLAFLQVNGCNEIQGYHFSPPLPAADFTRLLEQDKALPPYVPALHIASPRLVKM